MYVLAEGGLEERRLSGDLAAEAPSLVQVHPTQQDDSRGCTVPDLNRSNEPKKGTRTAVLMSARTVVLFYFILEQFFQVFHSVVTYLDPFLRFVGLHMEFIASYVKALLL